ncbi:hypothetical protein E9229_000892 [Paeniglutamicibacter cryotolerans]|uniref:Pyrroline-5-carboxylate reductase catalytic N-terminal domain-containing protein n=1 Tax=Paeniglutamicibacter cryotolerans TaxID=670079 RepID=A0A839QRK6_9MICC|nr:hypothetical protein [Paeniglutamicibacter cryotolerans]
MSMKTIGILGAGKVGTAVARQAMRAGYRVNIAASGDPQKIALIIEIMAPGATALSAAEVIDAADLVILSVPLRKFTSLDASALAGKHVVDTMNYWAENDGDMPELDASASSSEMVAQHLSGALVAKSLNHIGYHELEQDGLPDGTPGRRALAVASDHAQTLELVMELVEAMGYDAVDAGDLASGSAFESGTEIFNGVHTREQMLALLDSHALVLQGP